MVRQIHESPIGFGMFRSYRIFITWRVTIQETTLTCPFNLFPRWIDVLLAQYFLLHWNKPSSWCERKGAMNGKLGYRSNPKFFDQHILPMPNPMSNEKTPGCQMIPFSAVWPGQDQRRRRLDLQHGDAWAGNLSWSNYSDLTRPGPPNGGLVREITSYFREI